MTSLDEPRDDLGYLYAHDPSSIGVHDLVPETSDLSEKLNLVYNALISSPLSVAGPRVFVSVSSPPRTQVVICTPEADEDAVEGKDNGAQFQYTRISSTGDTIIFMHRPGAPHESHKLSSRVVQGEQKEFDQEDKENDGSSTSTLKQVEPKLKLCFKEFQSPPIAHVLQQSHVDVLCGHSGLDYEPAVCKSEGLIEGRCHLDIPFFPSFIDNLGPRYRGPILGEVMMTPDNAPLRTPDSSARRTVHDLIPYGSESDELQTFVSPSGTAASDGLTNVLLTVRSKGVNSERYHEHSIHKHSFTLSGSAAGDGLTNVPLPVRSKGVNSDERHELISIRCKPLTTCSRCALGDRFQTWSNVPLTVRSKGEDNNLQLQCTPVSSTGSTTRIPHPTSRQLTKSSSSGRLKHGMEKILKDDWDLGSSTRLSLKRVRPLAPLRFLRASSYPSDDVEDFTCTIYAVESKSLNKRQKRTPMMRISPCVSCSRSKIPITLSRWHSRLGLDNPHCSEVATQIFSRGYRTFQRSSWPETVYASRLKLLMASAFWIASKISETRSKLPKAHQVADVAKITAQSLIHFEVELLDALQWKLTFGHDLHVFESI